MAKKPARAPIDDALSLMKPIVIMLAQQKGGVGKTTLARTLAEYFSIIRGKSVVAMDFDTQGSLSKLYLNMESDVIGTRPKIHPDYERNDPAWALSGGRSSTASFYMTTPVLPYPVEKVEIGDADLGIVPADANLIERINQLEHSENKKEAYEAIQKFFNLNLEHLRQYDVIIMDTPPTKSMITKAAMRAATHIVIPIAPQQQCLDGLDEMMTMYREEQKRRNPGEPLHLAAYQWNLVSPRRSADQALIATHSARPGVAEFLSPVHIENRAAIAERDVRTATPRTIFSMKEDDPVRKQIMRACEFIEARVLITCKTGEGKYRLESEGDVAHG